MGRGRDACESGCFELFLLWVSELFHFVTDAMIRSSAELKAFFGFLAFQYQYWSSSGVMNRERGQRPFDASSLLLLTLAQRLLQITASSFSHVLPRSLDIAPSPSACDASTLLFLLQFFDSQVALLFSTVVRTDQFLKNCDSTTPSLPSSARKIRPGTVSTTLPLSDSSTITPLLSVELERSATLLKALERQNPEQYPIIHSFCLLVLDACAKQRVTHDYVNSLMKECSFSVRECVRQMYAAVQKDSVETVLNRSNGKCVATTPEEGMIQLQNRVECILLKEVMTAVQSDYASQVKGMRVQLGGGE